MELRQTAALVLMTALASACAREEAVRPRTGTDVPLPVETRTIQARVPRHATLDSLLRAHAVSADLVQSVIASARGVFNPRQLRANRPYRLVLSFDGFLREFEYEIDADRFLRIINLDRSQPTVLAAEVLPIEKETSIVAVRGAINADQSSLIAAMEGAGENIQLALAVAEVFSGQIDFESDLQPGDTFEVLVQKATRDGQPAGYGPILGASFSADGRRYQAFRWEHPGTGKAGYYDENGRSLKRLLLASPLKFEPRITSRFSRRRFHPVLSRYRPHLGVDYGAPYGSAVVAVADGTVVSAGWAGGGGKQIRLRHGGGLETYYLHLSAFAKGIRPGARVSQGQVIGRVGATGTATGPHLDFRLRRNGVFVDPVAARRRQPPGEPIPAVHLAAFRVSRDGLLRQLSATVLAEAPRPKPDAIKAVQ